MGLWLELPCREQREAKLDTFDLLQTSCLQLTPGNPLQATPQLRARGRVSRVYSPHFPAPWKNRLSGRAFPGWEVGEILKALGERWEVRVGGRYVFPERKLSVKKHVPLN